MGTSKTIKYSETNNSISLSVPKPSLRYLDEFTNLKCAPDLLSQHLFPNAKEITESMGAFNAYRKCLISKCPPDNPFTMVVAVGDGVSPRTGAVFAIRTQFTCISVDPQLRINNKVTPKIKQPLAKATLVKHDYINRLYMLNAYAEDLLKYLSLRAVNTDLYTVLEVNKDHNIPQFEFAPVNSILWTCVHSHAPLKDIIKIVHSLDVEYNYIISIPCCYPDEVDDSVKLLYSYEDMGIHSEMRTVNIYDVLKKL